MPRAPGRESTAPKIPLEFALVSGFRMSWEKGIGERGCCIAGCEHACDGRTDRTENMFQALRDEHICGKGNAGVIADNRIAEHGDGHPFVGFACPHCVDRLMALEQV